MESFNSLRDFFIYLNDNCTYLILRNWDDVFNDNVYGESHEDIDILCADINLFKQLTKANNIHKRSDRDNYIVKVGGMDIRFDVRHIGDDYYPAEWEKRMLSRREKLGDIFIMCHEDYVYSLIYHALLQKPYLSDEYKYKISSSLDKKNKAEQITENTLLSDLILFIKKNGYIIRIPSDPGVYINWNNLRSIGYSLSLNRCIRRFVFKLCEKVKRAFNT